MKRKSTKLEKWVDEISRITNRCPLCAYIDKNGVGHIKNVEVCKDCCWYHPSQFKERKE